MSVSVGSGFGFKFLFHLDGYRDYSVTRVITGDRLEVRRDARQCVLPDRRSAARRDRSLCEWHFHSKRR